MFRFTDPACTLCICVLYHNLSHCSLDCGWTGKFAECTRRKNGFGSMNKKISQNRFQHRGTGSVVRGSSGGVCEGSSVPFFRWRRWCYVSSTIEGIEP